MPNPHSPLVQFSDALSALTAGARGFLAEIRTKDGHRVSGVLWKSDAVVVSEQALPEASEYEVRVADRIVKARLAGRDGGTNVAVLRLESEITATLPPAAIPLAGSLALALGMSANGITARLAILRSVGEAWESLAGGTIDHRITLDSPIGPSEEGGPVLAADGAILGISTRGAGRQSLVIPASTIERVVGVLLEKGSVERGWLGVALRPVALPEALRPDDSQRVGLMVMDVGADSPAAKAGILAGDILLSAGGAPATRFGKIARQLGANSIGKKIQITLARAGAVVTSEATIAARKAG
ncbi:MAG TPA: S1C family serine protease [Micropepsaceae bacterium]|nr:S1C family serine protease [Micropepsaceae bacterium]